MKVNYYEVLGVQRSASEDEIRNQFRKLARENHPDRYKGSDKSEAERKFQTLTEAVNVLTNADKRRQHDAELSSGNTSATVDFAQIARAYVAIGAKAWKEGDFKTAYENFDLAVKHNTQDAKAYHHLARAASRLRGFERQAVQAIEAAVQLDRMNPQYLKDAGLLSKKAGLTAKAERYLEEALKWDAGNIEVQSALAEIRQGRAETKESGKGFSIFRKG